MVIQLSFQIYFGFSCATNNNKLIVVYEQETREIEFAKEHETNCAALCSFVKILLHDQSVRFHTGRILFIFPVKLP